MRPLRVSAFVVVRVVILDLSRSSYASWVCRLTRLQYTFLG